MQTPKTTTTKTKTQAQADIKTKTQAQAEAEAQAETPSQPPFLTRAEFNTACSHFMRQVSRGQQKNSLVESGLLKGVLEIDDVSVSMSVSMNMSVSISMSMSMNMSVSMNMSMSGACSYDVCMYVSRTLRQDSHCFLLFSVQEG